MSGEAAVRELIGNYDRFVPDLAAELASVGIVPPPGKLSHLGYKAPTVADYERVRDGLTSLARGVVENVHNGRPIAKIILADELILPGDLSVDLIEVMPPKDEPAHVEGLEHVGFVVGPALETFAEEHRDVLTGRQDQGPYCQPVYVRFPSGLRAKFYEHPLETVVKLEGRRFSVPARSEVRFRRPSA